MLEQRASHEEALAKNPEVRVASVINKNSDVLADSNHKNVGKNMLALEAENSFANHSSFMEKINEDWSLLLILENRILFKSLKAVYLTTALVLLVTIMLITSAFLYISRKYEEAHALANEVRAVSDIYLAVAKISLQTGSVELIRTTDDFTALFKGDFTHFPARTKALCSVLSSKQSYELLERFMDTKTLPERLKLVNSISQEILDSKGRWLRIRFITVDYTLEGDIHHVLWALESIDEDRKQQEKLRKLSETDMMTGIKNRGTGEQVIRSALAQGTPGMFCLVDIDLFKSINDTYGHQAGDDVICAVADSLKTAFRDADIVFRLGGDEFAAFAHGVTAPEIGEKIIQRFFERIRSIYIPAPQDRTVSVSVGAAFYPKQTLSGHDGFETLYQRADESLYKSKKSTGNALSFAL